MLNRITPLAGIIALTAVGCQLFGSNPVPPSKFEQGLFLVHTNYQTNIVPVTNIQLKVVEIPIQVTNTSQQVVWQTNVSTERITNFTFVLVTNEAYTYQTREETKAGAAVVGTIANIAAPGAGGWVTALITLGLGSWAQWRSTKRQATSVTLAQQIETLREFIKTLPQGAKYDEKITEWLNEHQVEAGVAKQVVDILATKTDNDAAKGAASNIVASANKPS